MSNSALVFALSALKKANTANERIDNLPLPMVFKGSLGTGGTISTLPTASSDNEGYVYIVITDGTYAGQAAKAGDTFVSDGSSWVLVPSADEPSVIDDSVTSTALTWSSKKISDRMTVKSFTYTGNGSGTRKITLPDDCHMILSIVTANLPHANYDMQRSDIVLLIDGVEMLIAGKLGNSSSDTQASSAGKYTYSTVDNSLTMRAGTALYNFNFTSTDYTVYYI